MLDNLLKAFYHLEEQPVILILVALLLFMVILYVIRKRISSTWTNFKTQYCLNHLGLEQISNINCPDGLGHYFNIDRLVLRGDGVSLLVYKKYPGKIFCADHINDWTQMIGQKSFPFKNPLFELDYQIKALSACIPGIHIDGYLFFDQQAEFPKGHPQRVIHLRQIPEQLKRHKNVQVDPLVKTAWSKLKKFGTE